MIKYEQPILDAFKRLGFLPRVGQVEGVDRIVTAFIERKMENVVLSAPTGTGKSIIGAVTAEAISSIIGTHDNAIKSSISLCSTNVLSKQYDETFKNLAETGKYVMIKGAGNYDCSALSTAGDTQSAESCAWFTMVQKSNEFSSILNEHCNQCGYLQVKKQKNLVRHLTTNYSYFFIDRMYTGKFEERDLLIWDEAHLINDLFAEHNAIHFSQKRLQTAAQEIADNVQITDLEVSKLLMTIAKDCTVKDKINERNYVQYLNGLIKIYRYAKEHGTIMAERALRSGQHSTYTKLTRFVKKYEGLVCKIDDLFNYDYEHVFDWNEEDKSVTIKPVFVGTMMKALQCGSRNLFMSATVSGPMLIKTLGLDPEKTEFIQLEPTFAKENKEVIFFDAMSLNYTSLQNPATVKALCKNVAKVVKKHVDEGERGIILAPSFKLQEQIVAELKSAAWSKSYALYEQRKGEKLEHTLSAFKAHQGGPAVLISPAMFEGVDLPGDLARFQIMVKAPFPSLGDKRVKWILDHAPDIYNMITVQKMVQGFGRSVRSADDYATSYCLDQHGQRLFSGPHNIWKNEFSVRYTKFL